MKKRAVYLRPSMIRILRDANKHFVAVLKENQSDLLAEARRLLPAESPERLVKVTENQAVAKIAAGAKGANVHERDSDQFWQVY